MIEKERNNKWKEAETTIKLWKAEMPLLQLQTREWNHLLVMKGRFGLWNRLL